MQCVRLRQHVLVVRPCEHRHHRTEDLLAGDAHRVVDAVEHRGGDEEPVREGRVRGASAAGDEPRPLLAARGDEARDPLELPGGDDRPDLLAVLPGSPTGSASTSATSASSTAPCSDSCTNTREVELHDCPWRFMFIPFTAAFAARAGSASGKMMMGFLPPSSRVTSFSPSAASRAMMRPSPPSPRSRCAPPADAAPWPSPCRPRR